jgi:hypothetical protein
VLTSLASARQLKENPYHDRIENNVLIYTGAGREGDQSLGGVNRRLPQQAAVSFPIYGFIAVGSRRDRTIGEKRWRFLGLLEYLRHYPDSQIDVRRIGRKVWLFEFRIHTEPEVVNPDSDYILSESLILESRRVNSETPDEREVVTSGEQQSARAIEDADAVEAMRAGLLATDPRQFEHVICELLKRSGFENAAVTRFSQDGGIDVNAYAGAGLWMVKGLLVQVQAKRWLHTVGRREVAELRGSLQPHARGSLVTTSHFSRAAILEAIEAGKSPIILLDGYEVARLCLRHNVGVSA